MTQAPLPGSAGRPAKTPAQKEAIRAQLRRVGLVCIIAGLVLAAIGLVDVLLGNGGGRFWMILTGIPLAAVGGRMLQLSNTQPKGRK
jgi:hypothetical protein